MLELAGTMLEAGEGSGACNDIQPHPTQHRDAERDSRALYGAISKDFVDVVSGNISAWSHTLGSVTALLVPTPPEQQIQQHRLHPVIQKVACP